MREMSMWAMLRDGRRCGEHVQNREDFDYEQARMGGAVGRRRQNKYPEKR